MVRLVKGAYWDSEVKQAQVDGAEDYPVFTRRSATDVSYICCASKLLGMTDRIYPQFATHNAQTAATILELAGSGIEYEFQRLHGMGETLFNQLREQGARCRIYAPVGPHKDLLAYLVRRLLENGANSSFVNKVVDPTIAPMSLAADPIEALAMFQTPRPASLAAANDIYAPQRLAARGWDLNNGSVVRELDAARERFRQTQWEAEPYCFPAVVRRERNAGDPQSRQPRRPGGHRLRGQRRHLQRVRSARKRLGDAGAHQRALVLRRAADLFESQCRRT
jgi:RHH-type proline utilization regulon transcriptional repressor/proline dehydrogenase/delta 1-pyrroline-5-carboxylate dehydrogenase